MPRITVASGPSNAAAAPGEVGYMALEAERGPELTNLPPAGFVEPAAAAPEAAAAARGAGPEDLPPADGPAPDYTSMTVAQLRDAAKTQGLPLGGSKADLLARLTATTVPAQGGG